MPASIPNLIEQLSSPDFNTRALALAELVHKGKAATAALMEALKGSDDLLRVQAAQGLAEIADPASADALAQLLDDCNDVIRARGAQGLALMKDSRALDALVRTISDFPDELRDPYTLSTYGLIELGRPALPAVVPLLKSADPMTRQQGFLVVRSIVSELPEGKDWNQLWRSLGSYNPHGNASDRDRAADQWLKWIHQQG